MNQVFNFYQEGTNNTKLIPSVGNTILNESFLLLTYGDMITLSGDGVDWKIELNDF